MENNNQVQDIKPQPLWYIIHTYAGYENKVHDDLRNMIENNSLQDDIFEIVVPTEEDIVEKDNGKKKVVLRKKFPSYVFLKMVYSKQIWYMVVNTSGVTGFLGPGGRPLALTDAEVKRLRLERIEADDLHIKEGDNVKIIDGALETFIGVVDAVNIETQKVKVKVSMFGRETPVELDFVQVEKI